MPVLVQRTAAIASRPAPRLFANASCPSQSHSSPAHATATARLVVCLLLAATCITHPPIARAQGSGLSLGWQDCRSGDGLGGASQSFGCGFTINSFPLFPALRLASAIDSVYSMELVIDVIVAGDALPPWWHMEPTGCRPSGWSADTQAPAGCSDVWGGLGDAAPQGWLVGVPGGSASHARLLVATAVLPENFVTLDADVSYSLCRVLLRSVNALTCAGCTIPACLVFNSVIIRRLPGSSFEEVVITSSETAGINFAVWQGGSGADCQAVPVRRSTWGAVKALYR